MQLQQAITRIGWPLAADGVFGPRTAAALTAVQRANGLPATGALDDATARLLACSAAPAAASAARTGRPRRRAGPAAASTAAGFATYDEHGARVVALQNALIAGRHHRPGGADGVFGAGDGRRRDGVPAREGPHRVGQGRRRHRAPPSAWRAGRRTAPAAGDPVALEAKPVQGPCYYGDTWSAARGNGRSHLGVDILAAEGNQLYAVATGTITQIYTSMRPARCRATASRSAAPTARTSSTPTCRRWRPASPSARPSPPASSSATSAAPATPAGPHLHLEVHPGGGSAVNPYPIVKAFGAC